MSKEKYNAWTVKWPNGDLVIGAFLTRREAVQNFLHSDLLNILSSEQWQEAKKNGFKTVKILVQEI